LVHQKGRAVTSR